MTKMHLHVTLPGDCDPKHFEVAVLNGGLPLRPWEGDPSAEVPVEYIRCDVVSYDRATEVLVIDTNSESLIHAVMNSPQGSIKLGECG